MEKPAMQQIAVQRSEQKIDVLIVGYGSVGAALAAMLGRQGVRCLVIDRLGEMVMMPRAIALDNEALRILQMAGLSDQSFARYPIQEVRMHCPYLGQFARVNTSGTIDGQPKLVTFYQPDLEQALRNVVNALPDVTVLTQTELLSLEQAESGVSARVRTADGSIQMLQARYLVGADGASSTVRQLIGQAFEGETYAEDWLIVDVREGVGIDHVEFICDPKRPTPHMPAPGGRERWEFMLHPGENREDMLKADNIARLMAPWLKPEQLHIERQAVYRFHARCCHSFQLDKVFLVGDAAHVTPPFVGQGLVAGLRDVANLSWKLAWVVQGKAKAAILDSYDTERRPHARKMINMARWMGKLVMPRSALKAILVHGLMRFLGSFPLTKAYFEDLEIKPANRFSRGLFQPGRSKTGLRRGGLFPQDWLRTADGIVLSDDVCSSELLLIGLGTEPTQHITARTRQAWQAAGGSFFHIGLRGQSGTGAVPFAEALGDSFQAMGGRGWLFIVRPDRVVMLDGPTDQGDTLVQDALVMLCN